MGLSLRDIGAREVTDHLDVPEGIELPDGHQLPVHRVGVLAVSDGLKMEVAAGGRTRSAHPGDYLPHVDGLARLDGNGFEVVVGRNEPVSMVDFGPVAAAPRVPANGPYCSRVGRVNPRATGCGKVLAPVKFARQAGQGVEPESEPGRRSQFLEGCHQGPQRRTRQAKGREVQLALAILGDGSDLSTAEGKQGIDIRGEGSRGRLAGASARVVCHGRRCSASFSPAPCHGWHAGKRRGLRAISPGRHRGQGRKSTHRKDHGDDRPGPACPLPGLVSPVLSHVATPARGPPDPNLGGVTLPWEHR